MLLGLECIHKKLPRGMLVESPSHVNKIELGRCLVKGGCTLIAPEALTFALEQVDQPS